MILAAGAFLPMRRHTAGYTAVIIASDAFGAFGATLDGRPPAGSAAPGAAINHYDSE
jgi:hypothetical protein